METLSIDHIRAIQSPSHAPPERLETLRGNAQWDEDEALALAQSPRGRILLRANGMVQAITEQLRKISQENLPQKETEKLIKVFRTVTALCQDRDSAIHFGIIGAHRILARIVELSQTYSDEIDEELANVRVVFRLAPRLRACLLHVVVLQVAAEAVGQIIDVLPPVAGFGFPMSIKHHEGTPEFPQLMRFSYEDQKATTNTLSIALRAEKHIRMKSQDDVGQILWPGAVLLSQWIINNRSLFCDKAVLEVGAGMGLSGIVASHFASTTRVTDFMPEVLKNLRYNAMLNKDPMGNAERLFPEQDLILELLPHPIPSSHVLEAHYLDWSDTTLGSADASKHLPAGKLSRLPTWSEVSEKADQPQDFLQTDGDTDFLQENDSSNETREEIDLHTLPSLARNYRFDYVIGSDMVCSPADVAGIVRVLHQWLAYPQGVAYFVLPPSNVRWGIQFLHPVLSATGFDVCLIPLDTGAVHALNDTQVYCALSSGAYSNGMQLWCVRWIS
eukprot:gb/GECG01016342.1/.p1 GENE.gb/GECG01016342.1/~~gb/GECG01016342.1/.p1  ORF type:complete len:502 (+),score=51.60 gb/GECG01016342.1/:1-1506(+)